jgi:hypothetical protein
MAANQAQCQNFSDGRIRPRCAALLLLIEQMQNDKNNITDVFAAWQAGNIWTDTRQDPPHIATNNDCLSYNTVITNLLAILNGTTITDANVALAAIQAIQGQLPVIRQLPINPVPSS